GGKLMDQKYASRLITLAQVLVMVVLTTIIIYFISQTQSLRLDDTFFMTGALYIFLSCMGLFGDAHTRLDFQYLHAKSITSTQEDSAKEDRKNLTSINIPLLSSGAILLLLGLCF
ncbi:MAG: hypothetical protein ACRCW2_01945, partial [Cellulosilyticaceae bacterium]